MIQNEELTGVVDRFLFQNTENNYAVLVLSVGSNTAIVTGQLSHVQPGEQVTLSGSWLIHPKFGKQFQAAHCKAQVPTSIIGLKKYLGSGLIKGIGPAYAERLVAHFGAHVLDVINTQPERLKEVQGIGPQRITQITSAWQSQKDISEIMVFLHDKGVSTAYAAKIYKRYGNKAIHVLQENPYRLADDVWGIGFKVADHIAQNMGFDTYSVKRAAAGCLFSLSTAVGSGHLYVELNDLKEKTKKILGFDAAPERAQILSLALKELHAQGKITAIKDENLYFIALANYHASEKWIAYKIRSLLHTPSRHTFDIQKLYDHIHSPHATQRVVLNEIQQQGVLTCMSHKVTVITGGPGTGKTTLVKTLIQLLDTYGLTYKLAAPTGRAAKRLVESTGHFAVTLHRLLEYDPATHGFKHNEQNALKLDFLIIDEASMIDVFLAHSLLKAVPFDAHVVFVGDVDQLPSVGAGNFLHDVIASTIVPCIKLKHIFRQAHDSLIIVNAHKVNAGEFPTTFLPDAKRDFFMIKEKEPAMLPTHLEKIFRHTLPRYGIKPDDAMVLVPMNRGIAGTIHLNQELQKILNPVVPENPLMHYGSMYKCGDRIMQIKNNYDKNVFNGDIGTIHTIDREEQLITVHYGERVVEYELSELDELVLAYAISIHKSQGSEYAAAIIPIFMQHFTLLQRNLIYTAITRAKKICILIGQPQAIAMGVKNNKGTVRKTFLTRFLCEGAENEK